MKRNFTQVIPFLALIVLAFTYFSIPAVQVNQEQPLSENVWSSKKTKVKSGEEAFMKPDGFIEYYNSISKRIDENESPYKNGYRYTELTKSYQARAQSRSANLSAEFISRGPGNVGGRTRAIAIDPADNTNCTWFAGAASGGVWKTTDCGQSWTNLTPDLPNLSTNSIAQAASEPNVIYVGTGEVFAGNTTFVRGDGIYKSVDRGASWTLLNSTISDINFQSVNRIAVSPSNKDIVVIVTNTGVFKSINGGSSWVQKYAAATGRSVQDLQVDPNDYNIQYAGVNSLGIIKSIDAGESWTNSSVGIAGGVRFEVAVAPSNSNYIYTSTFQTVAGSDTPATVVYASRDKGANWVRVRSQANFNDAFLGNQGWYDNSIAVNPYNENEVFVGGISIGKYEIDSDLSTEETFLGLDIEGTEFLNFVTFGAGFNGGTIDIADGDNSPSENPVTVELRFGGNNSQKAHRFTIPEGETSGVPIPQYTYQNYVDVPFEAWDIVNNRQLMVSFRDQENNGVFNLNKRSEADEALSTAREYVYIHDVVYDAATPNGNIGINGGVEFANMYYFWPVLAEEATWDPATFVNSLLRFNYGEQELALSTTSAIYDAYGSYENQNRNTLHPDHHNLTFIKMDDASQTFRIVNGNDGGFGFSEDNGVTFEERESGYVTSQFYGADKKPGEDKYIGGMQDNGTYVSSGSTVDETNIYNFVIGGDGFEVIWHATDPQKVIGGSQFNGIRRSTNGGVSFSGGANGITDGPFITRLAGSNTSPDIIYALGAAGVYKSSNFGLSWTMKAINSELWRGDASAADVEVSLANDQIVWAGAGMASSLSFFVSTDAGETYSEVSNYSTDPQAFSTGIYTHPSEENTAYALFSRANFPKILKTTDLGQTWTDISGFEGNANGSDRGFPDVFTHSLLVMPFNTDIIWAGTEIGLFESIDGGASWNIRNDIPAVSIWSMKIVDDQVVIGTHGRGIWTATIETLAIANLRVDQFEYLGYGDAQLNITLPVAYEQVKVLIDDVEFNTIASPTAGNLNIQLKNFFNFDGAEVKVIGVFDGIEYTSNIISTSQLNRTPKILDFGTSIEGDSYPISITMENTEPFEKVEVLFGEALVFTDTQTLEKGDASRTITFAYDQASINNVIVKSYINDFVFTSTEIEIVTSNKQALNKGLKLFPNPAVDYVNLSVEGLDIQELSVYNAAGQFVMNQQVNKSEKETRLNVSSWDQGLYLIQIKDSKGALRTKRFIKQ
jgi:photosystem II stability/assembly factor-like uncharacterized protein